MSNRILSLLILVIISAGLFGVYYYFFASHASILLVVNGSGSTSVTLSSEFGNSYSRECEGSCLFEKLAAVNYSISAKKKGYIPFEKTYTLNRGEDKKIVITREKEITLTEQTKKKEDTIGTLKLKKEIQEVLEMSTGGITLGYQSHVLYYALPNSDGWDIFSKKEGVEAKELFKIPSGVLGSISLDIYTGHIALKKQDNFYFYSLASGKEMDFVFDSKILSIKDSLDDDTKIIKSATGVFMYTVSEKISRQNPLYDDIIQLPTGEIIALVNKTSQQKRSLLSITDSDSDYVFLIGQDTRERKTLFKTPKNGQMLRYKNDEILFIDTNGEVFVVNNL